MNLAAILPRLPQVGQLLNIRRQRQSATHAHSEQRTMLRNEILALENRPLQLRVLRGWVWITRDGCPADSVLGAGDVFEQQPGALVLVQAFEEAELLIAVGGARQKPT